MRGMKRTVGAFLAISALAVLVGAAAPAVSGSDTAPRASMGYDLQGDGPDGGMPYNLRADGGSSGGGSTDGMGYNVV